MGAHPKTYNKEEFRKFLQNNNVNNNIISKFAELPEEIIRNGNTYKIYINSTWYNIGSTYYSFELNYYCEENIEFLFSSKVFTDVELSINNLMCELIGTNCIKLKKK